MKLRYGVWGMEYQCKVWGMEYQSVCTSKESRVSNRLIKLTKYIKDSFTSRTLSHNEYHVMNKILRPILQTFTIQYLL